VTTWADAAEGEALRWLPSGVQIRPQNYGGEDGVGVWGAPWCVDPDDLEPQDIKDGVRPDPDTNPFLATTVWSYDECDLTAPSQAEVRARVAQNLRILEPVMVEREFSVRLLADAGTPDTAVDIVGALAQLEGLLAETNTVGLIHANPMWLVSAAQANLLVRSGSSLRTPGVKFEFGQDFARPLRPIHPFDRCPVRRAT
jgi:hypothetical protein